MMVFDWVIETSISASIIILIVIGIRALIKNNINPSILYYMWFIVIIKLIMPNGPESQISIYNVFSSNEVSVIDRVNKVEPINITNDINVETILKESKNEIYQTSTDNKIDYLTLKEWLFIIWIIGIGLLLIKSIYSYFTLRKYIRLKKNHNDIKESILLEALKILSFKSKVNIIISDKFESPALFGIVKPKIIIPSTIIENSTREELKYILLHELIHLKRKDNIIIWILLIIKTMYWFNPIVIMAIKLMQQDCEISCDGNVLNKVEDKESTEYGMAILKVFSFINRNKTYIGTTTMVRNKKDVKERIDMISRNKKYGFKTLIAGVVIIGLLGAIGLTNKISAKDNSKESLNNAEENAEQVVAESINSNVIIYNSHYEEDYSEGLTVVDAGEMLAKKLKEDGLEAEFLKNTKTVSYGKSYEGSRELIVNSVENYEEKILIDIHRPAKDEHNANADDEKNRRTVNIIVSKNSDLYEENKKFAERLIDRLELDSTIVLVEEKGLLEDASAINCFNQDLSSKAITLNLGSGASDKSDIEYCTEKISKAIKNL